MGRVGSSERQRPIPKTLRRSTSQLALDAVDYVVVDAETTGFAYNYHDRIIEIAAVRCRPDVGLVDRFVTLVNPERDLGPTHIHGVTAQEVLDPPRFHEVIGEVSRHLAGAVFVAHNVNFDLGFLRAEYRRAGFELPELPTLCTMTLPTTVGLDLPARSSTRNAGESLVGSSVCFTGQLTSTLRGEPITRDRAQMLAAEAGLAIRQGVTKDLDLLIVADPHSQSGKAKKARQYGTRILAEQTFWRAIGVPVD